MSEVEKKQIEGVCEEISEKNGWVTFSIGVGSQYPVRLSTKLPALVDEGRAVGQQRAVWSFSESEGAENPNRPGTNYINRRLEKVEVGGTVSAPHPQAQAASSTPTHAPLPPGDKDRAITRMAVLKAAAEIVAARVASGNYPPDDEGAYAISLASRFETWVYRDVSDIPF
jgi:hypothetical protein